MKSLFAKIKQLFKDYKDSQAIYKRLKLEDKIREYAQEHPNAFVKLAVEEIGAVELAEYLHHTGDLFELVDGLEAEALSNAKDFDDYYQQQETNYRG